MKNIGLIFLGLCFAAALNPPAHASPDKTGVLLLNPVVSPSGSQIAFSADIDGRTRIWLAGIDGTALRKVSSLDANSASVIDGEPAWSPDGRKIAFASRGTGGNSNIWAMQSDGAYPVMLTSNGAANSNPVWSPDGRLIAFVSDKDGTNDIWLMNADGSQQRKIVGTSDQDNTPSFSPTGDQIVFSKTAGDSSSLMIVSINGSGLRTLTSGNSHDWEPSWGTRGIVFTSNRSSSDGWKLWVIQPDGTGLRKLGDVPGHDPTWLPDGRILFTDETVRSKALSAISAFDPVTGVKQVIVDVQGLLVPIDIRPGTTPNLINPRSMGKVKVAVLSTPAFDATKVVSQKTLTFGRTGAETSLSSCLKPLDVNGDGIPDLVCSFDLRVTGFRAGDKQGVLRFTNSEGIAYEGRDAIVTVNQDLPDDLKN